VWLRLRVGGERHRLVRGRDGGRGSVGKMREDRVCQLLGESRRGVGRVGVTLHLGGSRLVPVGVVVHARKDVVQRGQRQARHV
jgi:hypothetical protein